MYALMVLAELLCVIAMLDMEFTPMDIKITQLIYLHNTYITWSTLNFPVGESPLYTAWQPWAHSETRAGYMMWLNDQRAGLA